MHVLLSTLPKILTFGILTLLSVHGWISMSKWQKQVNVIQNGATQFSYG